MTKARRKSHKADNERHVEELSRCSVTGCDKKVQARKLCSTHYSRLWRRREIGQHKPAKTKYGVVRQYLFEVVLPYAGDDCLTWRYYRAKCGYGRVGYAGKPHRAHRLVCELVHGAPPTPKHDAAHSCGKGHEGCVNPRHLRWDTRKGNFDDKFLHGTQPLGEDHWRSSLRDEDVREIRKIAGTISNSALGRKFGVSPTTVHNIVWRKTWTHVT